MTSNGYDENVFELDIAMSNRHSMKMRELRNKL